MAMGYHRPQKRSTNKQDGHYNRGGAKELSSQGVSRTDSNTDGNEGTLPTPIFQGHRDHTGGGQPTPPTVPPAIHTGALEVPERALGFFFQGGGAGSNPI